MCVVRSRALAGMKSVRVYDILNDNRLRHAQDIHLLTMSDNIYVHADTGDLWIGAHPVVVQSDELFQQPRQIYVTESSCARQV